jgi:hypothetical protein
MALTEPSEKDAPGQVSYTQSASKTRRYEGGWRGLWLDLGISSTRDDFPILSWRRSFYSIALSVNFAFVEQSKLRQFTCKWGWHRLSTPTDQIGAR